MNTTKTQLNTTENLEDFSKAEIITMYQAKAFEAEELKVTIEHLTRLLRLGVSNKFGSSSEQRKSPDMEQMSFLDEIPNGVFNEAEVLAAEASAEEETAKKKKGHARRIKGEVGADKSCFDHLPTVIRYEELSEEDQNCPHCGTHTRVIKTVDRVSIEIIPPQFQKVIWRQKILVCDKCNEEGNNSPVIEGPVQLPVIPGSYVSTSLMAFVMAKKYWEKTPIYRLEKQFLNSGIEISRTTMSKWVIDGAKLYLKGVYDQLHEELKKSEILHADETKFQVLKEEGRKAQQVSYMWHYASGHLEPKQIRLYQYQPSRAADKPIKFLDGYSGYLCTDAYSGYRKIPNITGVGCWAHARRKFVDNLKSLGSGAVLQRTQTEAGLDYFDKLFKLEHEFADLSSEERYKRRLEQSKPELEALNAWLKKEQKIAIKNSGLGQAVTYCLNQWDHLIKFLEDGRLEMTNNRAERGIKEFVIGRKNFLFSTSVPGAEASEIIFSIVETAKANDLHPYEYLKYLIHELSQNKQTPEKISEVMPWSDKLPEEVKVVFRQDLKTPRV